MLIGRGFGGAAGGGVQITGNGIVVHNGGQLYGVPLVGIDPVRIDNPEAQAGPPVFRVEAANHPIGKLIGADGNSTADQVIPIRGTSTYVLRRIVFCRASATPAAAMAGGIYTLPAKGGRAVVSATQTFQTLADAWSMVDVAVQPVLMAAPFLYLSLTTANGAALTFDVFVYGDVVQPIEG